MNYSRKSNIENNIIIENLSELEGMSFDEMNLKQEYNFTLINNDLYFDFKLILGETNSLIGFFNSAIPESKLSTITFPFFTGLGLSRSLKSSKVFFCDPLLSLSKENKAFWYVGSRKMPTQEIIIKILQILKSKLSIKKMVFWGSSGGGFPALLLSNIFPESIALVNAPTATLTEHHNSNVISNIEETLSKFIGDEISAELNLSSFNSCNNNVVFLQNSKDKVFIKYHLKPYLKSKGICFYNESLFSERIKVVFKDWGKGHLVAPIYILNNLLKMLEMDSFFYPDDCTDKRIKSIVDLDICVSLKNKYLEVKILNVLEEATYAAYLCKGSKVIDKIMYQEENTFLFTKKYSTGAYTIKAFAKMKKDQFVLVNNSITFLL